ncbi:MAG: hypothetical protein Q7R81_05830 [Candidatus Peregrinibacteria bacterium]|nr:hypothetical protein [Candidatus Peregrinibacteria bacterium]
MENGSQMRSAPDLREIHQKLRALYEQAYPNGAPQLYELLLTRLPEFIQNLVRRQLAAIVQEEVTHASPHGDLSSAEGKSLAVFLNPVVLQAHMEVGRDAALSNRNHSIAHFDTQPPIVAYNLITVASSENPAPLERMGCVFFDVDGTKTIVECTSHARVGKYLEKMAEFLCKPPPEVQRWLDERKLHTETYAYAGDEFIVVVRSQDRAIDKSTLNAFARVVQQAMVDDPTLNAAVTLDSAFAMEFDDWSDEDRAAYKRDPPLMEEKLRASQKKLMDRFIPSVSYGVATFLESLDTALSPDTEEAKTLEELGVNAFRLMVELADTRMKKDKEDFRRNIEDPLWKSFLLRNSENRRLEAERSALATELQEERAKRRAAEEEKFQVEMKLKASENRERILQELILNFETQLRVAFEERDAARREAREAQQRVAELQRAG